MSTVWINKWPFRVRHPVSGRATDVSIPGIDKLPLAQQENLIAWQTEQTLDELAGPEVNVRDRPFDRNDQHALGRTLDGIQATRELVKSTGHGRYW